MGYLVAFAMVVVLGLAMYLVTPLLSAPETLTVIFGAVLFVVLAWAWWQLCYKAVKLFAEWAWKS